VIVLDSHIWVWWVLGNPKLSPEHHKVLQEAEGEGLGVSIISCWEVAKLVELGRLELPMAIEQWLAHALRYPGVQLLDLTVEIVVDATACLVSSIATPRTRCWWRQPAASRCPWRAPTARSWPTNTFRP
jgi:PIN domain nuclease of toxin-antitoxin system